MEKKDRRKPPHKRAKSPKNSHTSAATIRRHEKMAEAIDYRKQGYTYRAIGEAMEIDTADAFRLVDEAIKETIREPTKQLIELELIRFDTLRSAFFAQAAAGDVHALDAVLKIYEKCAKLLGIEASTKIDAKVEHSGPVVLSFSPADATV